MLTPVVVEDMCNRQDLLHFSVHQSRTGNLEKQKGNTHIYLGLW